MAGDPKDATSDERGPETDAWAGLGLAWRAEELPVPVPASTLDVARRAQKFAWTIVWRNTREFVACISLLKGPHHGGNHWSVGSLALFVIALGIVIAVFALLDRLNARAAKHLGEKLKALG